MDDEMVTITLTGKLSYTHAITIGQAAQIISFIDSGQLATSGVGSTSGRGDRDGVGGSNRREAGGPSNPREALTASGAKTNPEKIVAFALYVSQEGDKDTFTIEDIKPLFRRARETTPGNITRDLDAAIKSGWVAESDVKGEYYVTDKVADVLQDGFDSVRSSRSNGSKPRSSGRKSTGARKPKSQSKSPPAAFANLEVISPTIDGYVNYHDISLKRDRFLWAVNAAKLWGVSAVSNQDLVWLTDQLGDGIPTNDVNGHYVANRKAGYVNRSTQDHKIRILPKGEDYIKSLRAGASE
jgi:hypothetical protein